MDLLTATSTYAILMQTEGVTRIEGAQCGGDRCGEVAIVCVCVCVRGGRWLLYWPSRLLALSLEALGLAGLELLACNMKKSGERTNKLGSRQGRGRQKNSEVRGRRALACSRRLGEWRRRACRRD
jgi:hypothetical protein